MKRYVLLCGLLSFAGCQSQSPPPDISKEHAHSKDSHSESANGGPGHMGHGGHGMHAATGVPVKLVKRGGWEMLRLNEASELEFTLEWDGLPITEFDLTHEKPMHLIIVRNNLDEFQHRHPVISKAGLATVKVEFPMAGDYWVYVDFKPKGMDPQVVRSELHVEGPSSESTELTINVPGTVSVDDIVSEIAATKLPEGWEISFRLGDKTGQSIRDLEPYLGAMGHLVVIGRGSGEYVHAHAETQETTEGVVKFVAHFSVPGVYKMWGQFQKNGSIVTIPAVIEIK